MSKVMREDARRYFEAAAASAEARDERRFAASARRVQAWLKRIVPQAAPQAI